MKEAWMQNILIDSSFELIFPILNVNFIYSSTHL